MNHELNGWNFVVYQLIKSQFRDQTFGLDDIYQFVPHFEKLYPKNYHVKDKIRQTLRKLRDKGLLLFVDRGAYKLLIKSKP